MSAHHLPSIARFPVAIALLTGCGAGPEGGEDSGRPPWVAEDRPDLRVTVTDASGSALAGAWVVATPGGRDAVTGEDGTALLSGLDPATYTVSASLEGYVAAAAEVAVEGDSAVSLALSAAAEGGAIAGTITGPDGLAVADAAIRVDGAEAARTDTEGAFRIEGLAVGTYAVEVDPPSPYRPWSSLRVEVTEGGTASFSPTVPGGPTDEAAYVGSTICNACHNTLGETWPSTTHANVGRTPAQVEADGAPEGLAASFTAADTIALDDAVPGARVVLARTGTGAWTAAVEDVTGATTGALPVVEVYGGHNFGAALAVEAGGTRVLLPVGWGLAGQGLSGDQDEAGWVVAWTDGWFDAAGALDLDATGAPAPAASWDLQCAGCHATGHALEVDGDGHYELVAAGGAMERLVGCEACHGPGSDHYAAVAAGVSPAPYILNPRYLPGHQRIEVCARCHERVADGTHPFPDAPGWAMDDEGVALDPFAFVADHATPDPVRWSGVEASRLHRDQAGDLRVSPHRAGPEGYDGACEDCHDPHEAAFTDELRADPADNTLCTGCHGSRFPDTDAQAAHSGHLNFDPGVWSPGACASCHLPRLGLALRPDAVSGAGEARTHVLTFVEPGAALAEFDAAGATTLPGGSVPTSACVDCHVQNEAALNEDGSACPCPEGDATRRTTYEDFQGIFELFRASAE